MYLVRLNTIVHKETKLVHETSPITCWLKRAEQPRPIIIHLTIKGAYLNRLKSLILLAN